MKKWFLRGVLIFIGILGAIWFLIPFAVGRIMNLGNGGGCLGDGAQCSIGKNTALAVSDLLYSGIVWYNI